MQLPGWSCRQVSDRQPNARARGRHWGNRGAVAVPVGCVKVSAFRSACCMRLVLRLRAACAVLQDGKASCCIVNTRSCPFNFALHAALVASQPTERAQPSMRKQIVWLVHEGRGRQGEGCCGDTSLCTACMRVSPCRGSNVLPA